MADASSSATVKVLSLELKALKKEPVEGFQVHLPDDSNFFEWNIIIFGPPKTIYEGGYFKAHMSFPPNYPYAPPTFRFSSKMWHPNIYEVRGTKLLTGDVCISILHPPVNDPHSGELPSERWNPTQSVRTILLSVISLLNEPNTFSPANVDASVMYRKWRDTKGKDEEYVKIIRKQVLKTQQEAERDGIKIPLTMEEYCIKSKPKPPEDDMNDFLCDDYADELDSDESDDDDDDVHADSQDSGNEES